MTTGMSLQQWKELGQLDREISIYSRLADKLGKVDIYTYNLNERTLLKSHQKISIGVEKKSRFWKIRIKSTRLKSYLNYVWNIFNLFAKKKYFKSIDIVKTNQYKGSIFGVILKKLFKKPLLIRMGWYHGHFNSPTGIKKIMEKWVFKNSDNIIVTNILAKTYISDSYKIKKDILSVIPNAIDTNIFSPIACQKEFDIVYVGRLHEEKNLELLISALKIIDKPLKILIVGDGDREIIERIKIIKLHSLKYINHVSNYELPALLNKAKLFVLLSKYEGNPKTLLEAMSCGLPVIGNNVPGISEVINHGENGYLLDNNIKELCKLIELIINSSSDQNNIGKNARHYIENNYSIEKIIYREAKIIKNIISEY
jgi:glycosyltransferase involved in cell wall biosynthesis